MEGKSFKFKILTTATVLFLLIIFLFYSYTDSKPVWQKGNLHTHTFWSDGDEFPERVVQWYKENGYDFLALTDHNIIQEGERWRKFPADHDVLKSYLDSYGREWVEMHAHENEEGINQVRLKTFEEYRSLYEEPGEFLVIQGNEISNPHAVHLLAFHQDKLIPASKGSPEEREKMIRETVANVEQYRNSSGRNTHTVLAHPNFTWAITAEIMINVPELRFFEVYNGHPQVNNEGDENRASTDKIWDIVLSKRLSAGKGKLLYGLATDDAHHYHGGGAGPGRGWVMVRTDKLSPEAILDALDNGDFYASTGIALSDIKFNGKKLALEIEPQKGAQYTTEFIGTLKGSDLSGQPATDAEGKAIENTTMRYSGETGKVLAVSNSLKPAYTFTGDELYVRARVTSTVDHIDPNTGKILGKQKAWVQPHLQKQSK